MLSFAMQVLTQSMLEALSWPRGQQGRTKKLQGPVTPLPLHPSGPHLPRQPQRHRLSVALNPARPRLLPLTSVPCHLPLCASCLPP